MASSGSVFQLTSLPVLSDEVVICFSSIVVLTPNVQFFVSCRYCSRWATWSFSVPNSWYSDGAKSGLRGGWEKISDPVVPFASDVGRLVWGPALSLCSLMRVCTGSLSRNGRCNLWRACVASGHFLVFISGSVHPSVSQRTLGTAFQRGHSSGLRLRRCDTFVILLLLIYISPIHTVFTR